MASTELYPDLTDAGGPNMALSNALIKIGSKLVVSGVPEGIQFLAYGQIKSGNRSSQVYIAANERLFLFGFWRDGVHFADARSSDINETAKAIDKWVATECSIDELAELPIVTITQDARSYEQGTEIEDRWCLYLRTIGDDIPELVSFVNAAAQAPQLRHLFPYTSLNRFCFSRCTGYPLTSDTPYVQPQEDALYIVYSPGGCMVGKGDAASAVKLVIANLPPNCGPAVRGTADTINAI